MDTGTAVSESIGASVAGRIKNAGGFCGFGVSAFKLMQDGSRERLG